MSTYIKECYKKTSDDWRPNFHGDLVSVTLFKHSEWPTSPTTKDRVCVWGVDDCGMEYDGDDADYLFNLILSMDDVTFYGLRSIGLDSA